jgi:prepilin-type N-terminal cleavage/methylation domain
MKYLQQGFTLIELMIVVAIIGILAAVAIPSYQDYTARAQVSEGMSLASQFKTPLAEFYADKGDFTTLTFSTLGGTTTGKYVASIAENAIAAGTIVVTSTFKTTGVSGKIAGSDFAIETEDGGKTWQCGGLVNDPPANPVDSKYVPGACK